MVLKCVLIPSQPPSPYINNTFRGLGFIYDKEAQGLLGNGKIERKLGSRAVVS